MSRSNPSAHAPHPCVRWYEWNGETGTVRYYDKTTKTNIDVPLPFTFLLLDELACVRGWDDTSGSGIYSNEVRDTSKDVLVVKTFKGGTIAEGLYKSIKDRINTRGAGFVANCYIAAKVDDVLTLCSLRFKGSALGAWMEFRKVARVTLYDQAIQITGYTEGKKGRIVFRMPMCASVPVSVETNAQALALDKTLQVFLDGYLQRKTHDQVAPESDTPQTEDEPSAITVDDIPF